MSWFRRKAAAHPMANVPLYAVNLGITAGAEPLPNNFRGAYVTVFCTATEPTLAAWMAIQAIEAMGYSVPENPKQVDMMPAADWEKFVSGQWPEFKNELPTQDEIYLKLADNRVVFGPFAGYDE
jgi:hypothetical protein